MEKCIICGAKEVETMSPRTTYLCGSSDYDQRPETFEQGKGCMGDVEGNSTCKEIDGAMVYCDSFKAMVKGLEASEEGSSVNDRSVKIGKATGTFNRCPFCMEWIGER